MKILDLTPGKRGIWFDKENPLVTFATGLPVEGRDFSLVVFDPPHVDVGASSNMSKNYGHHTTAEIKEFVRDAAREAHCKSNPDALMAFKWNNHDVKLEKILALMDGWQPLFGQRTATRTARGNSTYWVILRRLP
jgi:hypothetical protein